MNLSVRAVLARGRIHVSLLVGSSFLGAHKEVSLSLLLRFTLSVHGKGLEMLGYHASSVFTAVPNVLTQHGANTVENLAVSVMRCSENS